MAPNYPPQRRVLSLDGCGFRGLSTLLILEKIMEETSKRAGEEVRPSQAFDIICGSSTGGLIALLIGRIDLDCRAAIEIYKALSSSLVGKSEASFWDNILTSSALDERRDEDKTRDLIRKYIPDGVWEDSGRVKTLVTLAADCPEKMRRVNHVRSYTTPPQASPSAPIGHRWSTYEVARATVAQSIIMPPLVLQTDDLSSSYRDAGLCGFSNPTHLVLRDSSRIWASGEIGVVVSIGNGLSELCPSQPNSAWAPSDPYLRRFRVPLPSERSAKVSEGSARIQAENLAKYLVTVANDAEMVHREVAAQGPVRGIYFRIDPPLPYPDIALVDCFPSQIQKVEAVIRDWLAAPPQMDQIACIAAKLVEEKKRTVITLDEARLRVPPPPPAETNPGYNPHLDKRRPQELSEYLQNYQVVFIVDDSASMNDEGRWDEAKNALSGIADYAKQYVPGTMEVLFLNSPVRHVEGQDTATIADLFVRVQPEGNTPTGAALKKVLDAQISKLDPAIGRPEYADIKPLDIIIITDGKPTDQPEVVVEEAAAHLQDRHHHPNCIGIQFVQIGHKMRAASALAKLINCKNGNMVDTVPYTATLDSDRLRRILLGGLHPNIRALLPRSS